VFKCWSLSRVSTSTDWRRWSTTAVVSRCWKVFTVVNRRGGKMAWHGASNAFGPREAAGRQFYARQVRLGLEDLGPTFVKLGQLLSTRSDVIPPTLQHELSLLRDHASIIPKEDVLIELERSTGTSISNVFGAFNATPVASASIGQVHRATLTDGRQVAVKVRRPEIRSQIELDVTILTALTRWAHLSRTLRRYDLMAVMNEFSILLRAETDFTTEASNIEAVRRTFANDAAVSIPTVVLDLTSESILVMDWIEGISLTDSDALLAAGVDRNAMARAIIHAYAKMIVQSDRFHADPHPGNFIAMSGGRLGLVDFGEVGTVTVATRDALTRLLLAVVSRDSEALAEAVLSMSRVGRPVDRAIFSQELAPLMASIVDAELQDIKLGRVLRGLLHVLRRQGLMLPPDLAVLVKTVIECEATADELDPTLSLSSFLSELGSVA
jgi:ubiquinone biosynthesis protein